MEKRRPNAMLVELVIVVLLFSIAATVLMRLFAFASERSNESGKLIDATVACEDICDRIYINGFDFLEDEGFENVGGEYKKSIGGNTYIIVEKDADTAENGVVYWTVTCLEGGNKLIKLDGAKLFGGEGL